MALISDENVIFFNGRLCADPADLTTDFPHGGTALGQVRDGILMLGQMYKEIEGEEFGGVATEVLLLKESVRLLAVTVGYDNDMLSKIFAKTSAGSVTGDRLVESTPAGATFTDRYGTLGSGRGIKLCVSPTDTIKHPFIVLYNAVPMIQESAEVALRIDEEYGIPVEFRGITDSSGRLYAKGKREDITV